MKKIYLCNYKTEFDYQWTSVIVSNKKAANNWLNNQAEEFCKKEKARSGRKITPYIEETWMYTGMPF